jgi:VIT1/CCC1 family predicted Fe2+/Mn2+ transporter
MDRLSEVLFGLIMVLTFTGSLSIALLCAAGHAYGRLAGRAPFRTGLEMVALGLVRVGLTIALGG